MWKNLWRRWADWTGDKQLSDAIRSQLARQGYAVHSAQIREVRLAAIERPGWVQVYRFFVETSRRETPDAKIALFGASREDGRLSKIEILLTEEEACWRQQLAAWSDGLIAR